MVSFKDRLYAWRTVIFALFLRELQSKFNDKFGLSWAFIEPFLFIALMSFVRGRLAGDDVHGIPVFVFMAIGLLGLRTFTSLLNDVPGSLKKNKPLYAFRQVQPIASMITAGFLELSIKVVVIALIVLFIYLLGLEVDLHNPLMLIFLTLELWILGQSMGIIFGVAMAFVPEIRKLLAFLTRPLMFISCVFYSLQDIPEEYWVYFTWNPLVHFIELARYACYESYGDRGVSLAFTGQVTLTSLTFALAVYHITWKKVLAR